MSMGFKTYEYMKIAEKENVLLEADQWLWVIAAGNAGTDVSAEESVGCFNDVPEDFRPDSRILCIGAVVPGNDGDKEKDEIAGYSNFGERVDVFTYQSFNERCAAGTS